MLESAKKIKIIRILLIPFLVFLSLSSLLFIKPKISTDIQVLLPRDQWISSHLDFLRNSQIGSIIALSIELNKDNNDINISQITSKLTDEISKLSGVKSVFARIDVGKSITTAGFLYKHVPQILNSSDLRLIDKKITVQGLKPILKEHYESILRPGGLFRQKMIASDPLNLFQLPLGRLQNMGKNSGFKFKIHDSGLWNTDETHMLMIIYTDIPVTDPENAEILHDSINQVISETIPGQGHLIMSGHRHAIENRKILQHDIFITLTVAGIGFFLLFAIFFRDWRAIYVFILPIVGMICAVGLTLTFFKAPSAIILGLGATVIGIALDYGIHVFTAAKHTGLEREKALKNIRRPLIFSALTTLGVFWAFFFSGTPGYHQLAFASTCGIALSLLFSLICLPVLLPVSKAEVKSVDSLQFPIFNRTNAAKTMLLWLFMLGLAISSVVFTGFDPDIRKLDGISQQLKDEEAKFREIWGENSQAAISVIAKDIESAMEVQDKIAKFAQKENLPGFQSLSLIWPSAKTRKLNAENWDTYWKSGKQEEFNKNLLIASKKYSFSESAFKPFFNQLYKHDFSENLLLDPNFELFTKKFINYEKNQVRISAFFDDEPSAVVQMKEYLSDIPEAEVISPKSFGAYISTQIIGDAVHIAIISICLVIILAYFCLRSLAKTVVALLPVISAIMIIIPVFALLGMKINAVALVACIVVTGLAIDYGIFAVSACDKHDKVFSKDALKALTLSVLSTAIGAAALLWAGHPALRSVGLVITFGVLAGYLGAVFASPALYKLVCEKK